MNNELMFQNHLSLISCQLSKAKISFSKMEAERPILNSKLWTTVKKIKTMLFIFNLLSGCCLAEDATVKQLVKRSLTNEMNETSINKNNITSLTPQSNAISEKQDCPIVPKIDIMSYSRPGFEPETEFDTELVYVNRETPNIIFAPFAAHITLQCISRSPIEWTFDGPFHPSISSIQVFHDSITTSKSSNSTKSRSFQSSSSSNSCYRIVVELETTKTSTGKYLCSSIAVDNKLASFWYLYGDGNSPPGLLYRGNEFNIRPNGSAPVVLPCQVVNPNLNPHLTIGDTSVIAIDNSVPYDPQIGFTLDLKKIPKPYGKYKCSVDDDPITFNIKQPPDYIVTPTSKKIILIKKEIVTLICEGKNPIGLQGFINEQKIAFLDYPDGSDFRYRVQYDYVGLESSEDVRCVDLLSKKVHHTWKIQVVDQKIENESGISYDSSSQRFICRSKTKDKPVMAVGQCSNPLECQLMNKCFTWDVPFKLTRTRPETCPVYKISRSSGTPCESTANGNNNSGDRNIDQSNEYSVGCVYVQNPGYSGVVRCTVPEINLVSIMYYFNGLKSGQKLVISDWRKAPPDELLSIGNDIHVVNDGRKISSSTSPALYVGESVQFACKATRFLFSFGFKWMFKMKNGSYVSPKHAKGNKPVDVYAINTYSQTTNLIMESQDIAEVVCFVHFWNTTDWFNISRALNISESIKPTISLPHGEETLLFATGSNESIICEAEGTPTPSVTWFRNGKIVESQNISTQTINLGTNSSVLYFDRIDLNSEGEYVCVASNVAGNETRAVLISIKNNRSSIYIGFIIAIVVLMIFILFIGLLFRKLKRKDKIIQRLTQKEYEQFRKGDKKALLNASNGYIRAQYLPYDDAMEIAEENLDIDTESILGSGEYGVVHRGILRQNNKKREVAVKTNKPNSDSNHLKALLGELKILTYIGWHGHDNVIHLLGAVTKHLRERDVYVVVEYCSLGNLENYLRDNKSCYLNQIVNDKIDLSLTFNTSVAVSQQYQPMQFNIKTLDLITWSYQIASGMEYLANKKIIHGDLASRNILLTEDRSAKITDFGLSKHLYNDCSNYVFHTTAPLPWKWLAPETLQYQKLSTQSDIWAYAITLWEIFSLGEVPYPGISYNFDFKYRLLEGLRMEKPEFANSCIWNVIQQCWATSPTDRPGFTELKRYFHWFLHHWDDPRGPPPLITEEVKYITPNEMDHMLYED